MAQRVSDVTTCRETLADIGVKLGVGTVGFDPKVCFVRLWKPGPVPDPMLENQPEGSLLQPASRHKVGFYPIKAMNYLEYRLL